MVHSSQKALSLGPGGACLANWARETWGLGCWHRTVASEAQRAVCERQGACGVPAGCHMAMRFLGVAGYYGLWG